MTDYNLAEESKKIWATLSKLNVNEFTEKKGNLTYLSWAYAYRTMMDHFPDMQILWYTFRDSDNLDRDVLFYPDRTASAVRCGCLSWITETMRWPTPMPVRSQTRRCAAS